MADAIIEGLTDREGATDIVGEGIDMTVAYRMAHKYASGWYRTNVANPMHRANIYQKLSEEAYQRASDLYKNTGRTAKYPYSSFYGNAALYGMQSSDQMFRPYQASAGVARRAFYASGLSRWL